MYVSKIDIVRYLQREVVDDEKDDIHKNDLYDAKRDSQPFGILSGRRKSNIVTYMADSAHQYLAHIAIHHAARSGRSDLCDRQVYLDRL